MAVSSLAFAEGLVCVTKKGVLYFETETKEYKKIAELGKLIPHQTDIFISSFSVDSVTFILYNSHTPYPDQYPTIDNQKWEHFEYVFVYTPCHIKQTAVNRFYKKRGRIISLQTNSDKTSKQRLFETNAISSRYMANPLYNRTDDKEGTFWSSNIRCAKQHYDSNNCLQVYMNNGIEFFFCGFAVKHEKHVFYKEKITEHFMVDIRTQFDYALFAKKVASRSEKQVWEYSVSELDIKTKREMKKWDNYRNMIYSFSGRYILAKHGDRYRVIDRENGYSEILMRKDIVKAFWVG